MDSFSPITYRQGKRGRSSYDSSRITGHGCLLDLLWNSMMKPNSKQIFLGILALIAGILAGGMVVVTVEALGHRVYPFPADLDLNDPKALGEYIAQLPAGAFLFVLLAYALGALAGSMVASLIGGRTPGIIVGALLCLFGFLNLAMIPHPIWFGPGVLIANGLGTMFGIQAARNPGGNRES
jgi:hypothetical protein